MSFPIEAPDFFLVAEKPEDLMGCVAFASNLRREGHKVSVPVSYRKVKRQIKEGWEVDASFVVILDDSKATILTEEGNRYETGREDALTALLDLWGDDPIPKHPLALQIDKDFMEGP